VKAVRLHGPKDIRIEDIPEPGSLKPGETLLQISAVGICGSDLHTYEDGRIGTSIIESPLILGHEFVAKVLAVGADALDGRFQPLEVGQRVAVDPATPCYQCEPCEQGNPNLCLNLTFCGLYPTNGSLRERMILKARNCFPIPDAISDDAGVLLEPLGVAIHALDLSKLKIANSVAVVGCGPIGLMILRLAKLAGADPIYAFDRFPWRVEKALALGATNAWTVNDNDSVELIQKHTNGRGVDIAFEAAWADESIQQAAEMIRHGGRLLLVGIPGDDNLQLQHSTVRRKGLTIVMVRRMKHAYPRAIQLALADNGALDLDNLVSHRFDLDDVQKAFAMNAAYADGLHKVIISVADNLPKS
jgi:L-iditol 2-dehydrogenase